MGRVRCSVIGCEHRGPVSYHRFPKDLSVRQKWIQFCKRGPALNPESARVCGLHFTERDFEKHVEREHLGPSFNKRRLRRESVPSVRTLKRVSEDTRFTIKPVEIEESEDFLSQLEPETILVQGGNNLSYDPLSSLYEENPDFSIDNASSNGSSSSSSTTLRRSTRTRYTTREDEAGNALLVDDSSNDGSSRRKDEEHSRVRRNLTRKSYFPVPKKGNVYDDKGLLVWNKLDLCDCFDHECSGCHFPCPKCKSPKCAHECRVNRRWQFETRELDGVRGSLLRNQYLMSNTQKKIYSTSIS
ncbi:uncharacterized protein [Lepeophtheirus salmonis]|nr:uncharacterized protein LOC121122984 [Lepeophtheirus salmonis]